VKRIGFVVHPGRQDAFDAATFLARWLRERDLVTVSLTRERGVGDEVLEESEFPIELDLVVSVGGDGTFLRAAHLAAKAECPVLGVNVGRVGFLTEVKPEAATDLLERVLEGRAAIEERMAIEATPDGAAWTEPQWALNEIMVEKRARHRVITLAAYMAGDFVATVSGDGVIVATPTGSTAYSFSARGPIVSPDVACLIVTPVAAHMVFDRSFVLAPTEEVVLEVQGEEPGLLSGDGREGLELPVGARVRIAASPRPARLVRRENAESFYRLVRDKFGLPGHPPAGSVGPPR
jgi:NAD+ kinase